MKIKSPVRSPLVLMFILCCHSGDSILFGSDQAATPKPEPVGAIDFFEAKIRPVLVKECYQCHSAEKNQAKGGLRLDSKAAMLAGGDTGPVIVPGKPAESVLLSALKYEDLQMPPKKKLGDGIVADFAKWIEMGAPDPRNSTASVINAEKQQKNEKSVTNIDFWAFKAPKKSPLPVVKNKAWVKNAVDRFILAGLEKNHLTPAVSADRRALIRRLYFDLVGLPPEPEAVEMFVQDKSPDAYEKLVDSLLSSPHYGERWGRHWLDLARYAEDQAHTFSARMYPQGYLYRDWVVNALNDDLPYDQFLKYQIAGDLVASKDSYRNRAALGLFALGPVYYQDNGEKDKAMADEWDDRVDVLMRGTQGLTIVCARCHDHKYDPISMKDYYGLTGIFASTDYVERPAAPDDVVEARRKADVKLADHQLLIDTFLAEKAPMARLKLAPQIPKYLEAALEIVSMGGNDQKTKKSVEAAAQKEKLDAELLQRWMAWLKSEPGSGAIKANRPYLKSVVELQSGATAEELKNKRREAAKALQAEVEKQARNREELVNAFGENLAFISEEDRANVPPGLIPLGNLFDDKKGVQLKTAVAGNPFKAVATDQSLGVARIAQGWGKATQLFKGLKFDFGPLGSDKSKHGQILNDAWSSEGGIRTAGRTSPPAIGRTEEGIGMHANSLITFDLNEIRKSGLIPAHQPMRFQVDRAGINDNAFGAGSSVHIAVIASRPNSMAGKYDAMVGAWLNGQPMKTAQNDMVYHFEGALPKPILADGRFVSFDVPIPPEAQYLTIAVTGAQISETENTINSDHAVLSGARLVYEPSRRELAAEENAGKLAKSANNAQNEMKIGAILLSEMFDDRGVLGLAPAKIDDLLDGQDATRLKALRGELAELKKAAEAIQVRLAHSLSEGNGRDLNIYLAGDPKKQGEKAPRAMPALFTAGQKVPFSTKGSGRLELAEAIASRSNPLTARVVVNRLWAGHFGTGIVKTLNNFGQMGERPSHPELIDYLAVELMESGWSLKKIHRLILLSATYQQSSQGNEQGLEVDPANRLLWRMNRRRLEIEPWRDATLAVSGQLDRTVGGPSAQLGENNRRRTFYGYVSRHKLNDLLRLFDFPDPNITAGERSVTTVPLQQLFVMNSEFMTSQARALAARLKRDAKENGTRVERAYSLLYGRPPGADEKEAAETFLMSRPSESSQGLDALEQLCLAMLGSNEFTYVD